MVVGRSIANLALVARPEEDRLVGGQHEGVLEGVPWVVVVLPPEALAVLVREHKARPRV